MSCTFEGGGVGRIKANILDNTSSDSRQSITMAKNDLRKRKKLVLLLKALSSLNNDQLQLVLGHLKPESYELLAEVFHNLTYNTLGLSKTRMKKNKSQMMRNKDAVHELIHPKTKGVKRRFILAKQMGSGLITAAISTVLPIIISAITAATSK